MNNFVMQQLMAGTGTGVELSQTQDIWALLLQILPFVALIVVFYFFMIRPQQKKEKKVKEMLNNMKNGDRITTIGGIYGRIVSIKDDILTIEVGTDKTKMVIARWAVRSVEDAEAENDQQLG